MNAQCGFCLEKKDVTRTFTLSVAQRRSIRVCDDCASKIQHAHQAHLGVRDGD